MDGKIWLLNRSLQLSFFQAYKLRVTHLFQLKQHSILVSVGQDEHGINPLVSWPFPLIIRGKALESNALILDGLSCNFFAPNVPIPAG